MNDGGPTFLVVDAVLARELGNDAAWLVALLEFRAKGWANDVVKGDFHIQVGG